MAEEENVLPEEEKQRTPAGAFFHRYGYLVITTLAAGETPALSLKLKPGADVLESAMALVEDLKLASQANPS